MEFAKNSNLKVFLFINNNGQILNPKSATPLATQSLESTTKLLVPFYG